MFSFGRFDCRLGNPTEERIHDSISDGIGLMAAISEGRSYSVQYGFPYYER